MLLGAVLMLMTLIVLAAVVAPLLRAVRPAPERERFDRAIYRDQLREVERDVTRGLVAPGEGRSARLEIERRLLATDRGDAPPPPPALRASPVAAIVLAAIVAAGTWAAYLRYGAPNVPGEPYAARAAERALAQSQGHQDLDKAAAELEAKLKSKPDDPEAWLLLGRTEAARGHWQQGADAFRRAMVLAGGRPDVTAAYGEMLVLAADGIVTPNARDAFAAALARDAASPVARYYLALAKAQQGNAPGALEDWRQLAADVPAQSPMRADIEKAMADTAAAAGLPAPAPLNAPPAPGPDEAAVAAASKMDPAQRQAMIRGMVEKLAGDMAQRPDDLQGWLRLARAYGVLGDRDKAGDAYERAAKLKPDDPEIPLAEAELLITSQPLEAPFTPRALDALHRAAALRPDDPAVLWYGGLAAAKEHDFATAAADWQKLLAALPADSAERKMVATALESIKDK
jgi:cytochrome c-type biogenesis protein CcmH